MKTSIPILCTAALLPLLNVIARAQENPAPTAPAAEAPAQTDMQKWLATTDAQWQGAFKRDVADVYETELNKVKLQYLTSLDDGIKKASAANDLNGALALRKEQKRFGDTNVFLEKDEEGDAALVKAVRAAIRAQLAQLQTKNAARAKALLAKYDPVLAKAQAQLTQRGQLDDALLVKTKREEVAAAWLGAAAKAASGGEPPSGDTPAIPAVGGPEKPGNDQPLAEFLPRTKWLMYGRNDRVVEFHNDGKFVLDDWTQQGLAAEWKANGPNQVTVTITSDKFKNLTATLNFDETRSWFTGTDLDKTRKITKSPRISGAAPAEATTATAGTGKNLLKNPNFEQGTNGWELVAFGKKGTMAVDKKETHNGKPSLRITNSAGDLTFVRQKVIGKPNTHYLLSGYIMTKDVEPEKAGKDWGACLMVGFTAEVYVGQTQAKARGGKSAYIQETKQWTKIAVDFTSGSKTELPVGAALGYYNENVIGTAWFAELSLVEIGHQK